MATETETPGDRPEPEELTGGGGGGTSFPVGPNGVSPGGGGVFTLDNSGRPPGGASNAGPASDQPERPGGNETSAPQAAASVEPTGGGNAEAPPASGDLPGGVPHADISAVLADILAILEGRSDDFFSWWVPDSLITGLGWDDEFKPGGLSDWLLH